MLHPNSTARISDGNVEDRKHALADLLRGTDDGIAFNKHFDGDGKSSSGTPAPLGANASVPLCAAQHWRRAAELIENCPELVATRPARLPRGKDRPGFRQVVAGVERRWRTNVASAVVPLEHAKKSDDLTTATVPAGTTLPPCRGIPVISLAARRQPSSSTS